MELPAWKAAAGWICAALLAILFIVSGVWKITDPHGWAARIVQMQAPGALGLPLALGVGIAETLAGVLILVPRFRRWGAWITAVLLAGFMAYIGANYHVLRGEECSCFPWLKRSVGPQFFLGDGLMILAAWAAGKWAAPSHGRRPAALVLAAITVFAGASLGYSYFRQSGVRAPDTVILADGKAYSLQKGRVLIYFFDPECRHCFNAAQRMSQHGWNDVQVVSVPTRLPQFAAQFLSDTGLKALVTEELDLLRKTFPFTDPPYAVALEHGRQKAAFIVFDEKEPEASLKSLGWIP